MEFSEDFDGMAVLSSVSLGADTIVGGDGSDAVLQNAALRGLLGDAAITGRNGADTILGDCDFLLCCDADEIVTGGLGDEVLFGDMSPDPLNLDASEWAGGAGEDVLVGAAAAAVVASFTVGAWTDGAEGGAFAAMVEDLKAGGQMSWAGAGADTLDLGELAA